MADAMKSAGFSKAKGKKSAPAKPKRTVRNISAAEKNKGNVPPPAVDDDDENALVLKKLRPRLPAHDDSHLIAENMKARKDKGLRKWRETDPYAVRRRTAIDPRFHTKEQQDFY